MSDFYTIGFYAVSALSLCLAFALYHIYSGISGSLSCANVGEVYNFEYLQPKTGEPERYMVKIIGVQTLTREQISKLNATSNYRRYDSNFQRTKHLVTAQTFDGKIRNFYAERTRNVRRPLLGKFAFNTGLASWIF